MTKKDKKLISKYRMLMYHIFEEYNIKSESIIESVEHETEDEFLKLLDLLPHLKKQIYICEKNKIIDKAKISYLFPEGTVRFHPTIKHYRKD